MQVFFKTDALPSLCRLQKYKCVFHKDLCKWELFTFLVQSLFCKCYLVCVVFEMKCYVKTWREIFGCCIASHDVS